MVEDPPCLTLSCHAMLSLSLSLSLEAFLMTDSVPLDIQHSRIKKKCKNSQKKSSLYSKRLDSWTLDDCPRSRLALLFHRNSPLWICLSSRLVSFLHRLLAFKTASNETIHALLTSIIITIHRLNGRVYHSHFFPIPTHTH